MGATLLNAFAKVATVAITVALSYTVVVTAIVVYNDFAGKL